MIFKRFIRTLYDIINFRDSYDGKCPNDFRLGVRMVRFVQFAQGAITEPNAPVINATIVGIKIFATNLPTQKPHQTTTQSIFKEY